MEPRKMVLMNLPDNKLEDTVRKVGVRQTEKVALTYIHCDMQSRLCNNVKLFIEAFPRNLFSP